MDQDWPDINAEWSQPDLHRYVRQMGINPDPHEIVPQGVKYIAWPQPPPTEAMKAQARKILQMIDDGKIKPLAVIRRRKDPRRN